MSPWDGIFIAFLHIRCNNAVGNDVKDMFMRCNKVIIVVRAIISLQFVCIYGLGLPGPTYIHSTVLFIKLGVTIILWDSLIFYFRVTKALISIEIHT